MLEFTQLAAEEAMLRSPSWVLFAVFRLVEGGQNLNSIRPNPHASSSLPIGLASEEMADWLGQMADNRADHHGDVMACKLAFLF